MKKRWKLFTVEKRMKKKVNPRRKPATVADVEKAAKQAQEIAVKAAWSIFFTVMRDKEGYGGKRLMRVWQEINELSDSVSKGYVSLNDLMRTLEDEAGIVLR